MGSCSSFKGDQEKNADYPRYLLWIPKNKYRFFPFACRHSPRKCWQSFSWVFIKSQGLLTERHRQKGPLTLFQMLLFGLPTNAIDTGHWFHVTLIDRWWVQDGLWCSSEANGQTCSTHQDSCHSWGQRKGTAIETRQKGGMEALERYRMLLTGCRIQLSKNVSFHVIF